MSMTVPSDCVAVVSAPYSVAYHLMPIDSDHWWPGAVRLVGATVCRRHLRNGGMLAADGRTRHLCKDCERELAERHRPELQAVLAERRERAQRDRQQALLSDIADQVHVVMLQLRDQVDQLHAAVERRVAAQAAMRAELDELTLELRERDGVDGEWDEEDDR